LLTPDDFGSRLISVHLDECGSASGLSFALGFGFEVFLELQSSWAFRHVDVVAEGIERFVFLQEFAWQRLQ
jgi:hypothetical protein